MKCCSYCEGEEFGEVELGEEGLEEDGDGWEEAEGYEEVPVEAVFGDVLVVVDGFGGEQAD